MRLRRWGAALGALWAASGLAQDGGAARAGADAAEPGESAPAPRSAEPYWEGALGLMLQMSPTYLGARDRKTRAVPGLFLRHGRWSITTSGGFVTRRNDEVDRGLAAEVVRREDLRVTLSARIDGGRKDSADAALAGLGDVPMTLRGRLGLVWRLGHGWQVSSSLSPDLLGRRGGVLADVGIGHEWVLSPTFRFGVGVGATGADARYQQSYFGVTPEQSARTAKPVYRPGSGLRDIGANVSMRQEISQRWFWFAGYGVSRLMGPAVDSPLTTGRDGWGLNGGLAWRF